MTIRRWENCVVQDEQELKNFVHAYLDDEERHILLVAGSGFDPRTTNFPKLLASCSKATIDARFIVERRPTPDPDLVSKSESLRADLVGFFPEAKFDDIEIFSSEGEPTVVAGRRTAALLGKLDRSSKTDIIIDISALSTGVFFPLVRGLLQSSRPNQNVHLVLSQHSDLDAMIVRKTHQAASIAHGFRATSDFGNSARKVKLWIPQLMRNQSTSLERLFTMYEYDDVCPAVPLRALAPRQPEELVFEFNDLFRDWTGTSSVEFDFRNLLFVSEDDPLDTYRTISDLHQLRLRTFEHLNGASTILSPTGTKVVTVGMLMAAIEYNLEVVYLESVGYQLSEKFHTQALAPWALKHVWLAGEAYS